MLDYATGQRMRKNCLDVTNPYKRDKILPPVMSLSSINENGML